RRARADRAAGGTGRRRPTPGAGHPVVGREIVGRGGDVGQAGGGGPEEDERAGATDPVDERALGVALDGDRGRGGDLEDVAGLAAFDVVAGDGLDRDAALSQPLADGVGAGADGYRDRLVSR